MKLHFIEADNLYHELQVEANSQRLIVEARTLREFLELKYGDNLGNILKQFTNQLGESIPKRFLNKEQLLNKPYSKFSKSE